MRAPGVVGLVQLAVVLALAVPLLWFGTDLLLDGERSGGVFVALGLAMLVLHRWLTNPLDPADLAEAAVERVGRKGE